MKNLIIILALLVVVGCTPTQRFNRAIKTIKKVSVTCPSCIDSTYFTTVDSVLVEGNSDSLLLEAPIDTIALNSLFTQYDSVSRELERLIKEEEGDSMQDFDNTRQRIINTAKDKVDSVKKLIIKEIQVDTSFVKEDSVIAVTIDFNNGIYKVSWKIKEKYVLYDKQSVTLQPKDDNRLYLFLIVSFMVGVIVTILISKYT